MPNHHPDQSLLLEYAAGSSAEPISLLIATHLALCPICRTDVSQLEACGGALFESLELAPVNDESLNSVLKRLGEKSPAPIPVAQSDIEDIVMPQPLRRYVGQNLSKVDWHRHGKNLAILDLIPDYPGYSTRLLRIAAGKAMPQHTHRGRELTLVLDGSFSDDTGTFERGDFAFADSHLEHRPIAGSGVDCICLAVNENNIRLTGPIGRWLNPFVRF